MISKVDKVDLMKKVAMETVDISKRTTEETPIKRNSTLDRRTQIRGGAILSQEEIIQAIEAVIDYEFRIYTMR